MRQKLVEGIEKNMKEGEEVRLSFLEASGRY